MKPNELAAAHTPEPPPASNVVDLTIISLHEKKQSFERKLELLGNRFVRTT